MGTEKTLQQLAQDALQVQDACNLSGVIISWARAMSDLREHLRDLGTDGFNHHPINVLWSSKVSSLTGESADGTFSAAYKWCDKMACTGEDSNV